MVVGTLAGAVMQTKLLGARQQPKPAVAHMMRMLRGQLVLFFTTYELGGAGAGAGADENETKVSPTRIAATIVTGARRCFSVFMGVGFWEFVPERRYPAFRFADAYPPSAKSRCTSGSRSVERTQGFDLGSPIFVGK
jgi:hypothetical protein